jgi:hypothetical protein
VSIVAKLGILLALFASTAGAQEPFTVRNPKHQKWPPAEADKIYTSSCAIVRQEFHSIHLLRPTFTLVLGADKDVLSLDQRELRLRKWNSQLFSEAIVLLSFDEMLPVEERLRLMQRAMRWAEATTDVHDGNSSISR